MKVVILGGGMAGMAVCTTLAKQKWTDYALELTVIDPKDFLEVRWASIRGLFDESCRDSIVIPFSQIFQPLPNPVTHIRARALSLSESHVTLDNGEEVSFDVCLNCTGSIPASSILDPRLNDSAETRKKYMQEQGNELTTAGNVLVIGGGAIGVEFAGDIMSYAKNKNDIKVILIQKANRLTPGYSERASHMMLSQLNKCNIDVRLGSIAQPVNEKEGVFKIKKVNSTKEEEEEEMKFDKVIYATGVKPGFQDDWIDTDDYGRVKEISSGCVFAHGDIVRGEPKRGAEATSGKDAIANNIRCVLDRIHKGESTNETAGMKTIPKLPNMTIVTTSNSSGVGITPLFTTSMFLPWIKNKTMFVSKAKGDIGW